jgi:hypothetical protein
VDVDYVVRMRARTNKYGVEGRSQLNTAHAMQRVWFELDNVQPNDHRMVHMVGSFTNWELTLLVTRHDDGKWGVWVDLPVGR